MTGEHKAALARGRQLAADVRAYLTALEEHRPRRGRKRTPETIRTRIEALDSRIGEAVGLEKVHMAQARIDLEGELRRVDGRVDLSAAEERFLRSAAEYSTLKGISYAAWREIGIPANILRRAGVSRAT